MLSLSRDPRSIVHYVGNVASAVGWLDASAADERRMREIVRLFSTRESRDELGIGQIRDALSDSMFPGASVVQTRARYYLIIPWLIADAAAKRNSSARIIDRVEQRERRLILHFLDEHDPDGLIGRVAKAQVKILPSTIYWSGLQSLEVVPTKVERATLDQWLSEARSSDSARHQLANVPRPPEGFTSSPIVLDGGFEMTEEEAVWLRDRIGTGKGSRTLLHHLAASGAAPSADAPWSEPLTLDASPENRRVLEHAELFSLITEGAALVYNLLLGEMVDVDNPDGDHVGRYREDVDEWSHEVSRNLGRLRSWDIDDLWQLVLTINPRLSLLTRQFVREWAELIRTSSSPGEAALSEAGRTMIREREVRQKRGQSRFVNTQLRNNWNGDAGTGRLDFRWGVVRRQLLDIHTGLGHVPA